MNVLYLAHRMPCPPDKGDKIRSYHQLQYLSKRHDVWCACFIDDPRDTVHASTLRRWCRDVVTIPLNRRGATVRGLIGMAGGRTMSESYYDDPRMRRVLADWSRDVRFDAALIYSSGMAPYRRVIRADRCVLDFCDWDSLKWRSYAQRSHGPVARLYDMEGRRLREQELFHIESFDACIVATEAEAEAIPDADFRGRVHVIGNGVAIPPRELLPPDRAPLRVGFVGQMDYKPNVDAVCRFAEGVWPHVLRRIPEATFVIVGRAPTREVRSLADRARIMVTGEVEDVTRHVEQFAVSVAPLRMGRGIQNKVLEAMTAARPVVLSPTAAAGIDAEPEEHFIVADEPDDFADRVIELLLDPSKRKSLGLRARGHVMRRYQWEHELERLDSLLVGTSTDRKTHPHAKPAIDVLTTV